MARTDLKLLTPEALEAIYMDGCTDQVSGDVEAPTGHFYRVGRQYSEWLGDEDA